MRKKCSTDREKVEAEGQYFANTRSICSNSERSEQLSPGGFSDSIH